MRAIDLIVELLTSVSNNFYNAYLETRGWIYPFSAIANFFYGLSTFFAKLAWQFYYFREWVGEVTAKIAKILTYENIASYFKSFFNAALDALEWTRNAFRNVTSIITTWWSEKAADVLGWINTARQTLQSGIDTVNKTLGTISETISNLRALVPTKNEVINWITSLLATKIKELEPFWKGWQEMRAQVIEFFTDPGKWFMDRIEGWLERFW